MPRKPDYNVAALNKQTDKKGTVGGAWYNDDATISIVLNSFVVLEGGKELLITLFPIPEATEIQTNNVDDPPF